MTHYGRCRAVLDPRFHGLLVRWLEALPPEGWSGTPRDLAAALRDIAKHREYVGRNVVPKVKSSPALAEAGFVLAESRTGTARTVAIRRGGRVTKQTLARG